jgi:hypothetical protein
MAWSRARRRAASAFGRRGARRRMEVLSKEDRQRVARFAAQARWAKTPPEVRSEFGRKIVSARWRKAGKPAARRRRTSPGRDRTGGSG